TGTGLFGIAGLVGVNVAPTKTEEQKWYDWYKAAPEYNVTDIRKWQPMYDNYAFGAGIQLGTIYDDGTTINLRAMLVVLIPGPVIMLEGKANLLKTRATGEGSQREEGAFYLLAVLDGRAGTFQLNIDVRYSMQDIINISGGLEAFFDFNNDQNWYIYVGRKEPESKRIQAEILSLFRANTYFMIDPRAVQLGASVGLNMRETWGPVSFTLVARISVDAAIFFKPFQLEGRLELMAEIGLSIFGIGLKLLLQLILEGKTPNPFYIYGKARMALSLPFPLPSFDFEVEFKWENPVEPQPVWPLLKGVSFMHHKAKDYAIDVPLPNAELNNIPTVAVDSTLVLTFAKRIHNLKRLDNANVPLIKETGDVVSGKTFVYALENVILEKQNASGEWIPVPVMQGINRLNEQGEVADDSFKIWAGTEGETGSSFLNGIEAEEPAIQLWQYKPYSFTNTYQRDNINDLYPPCKPAEPQYQIVHWRYEPRGKKYPNGFEHQGLEFQAEQINPLINYSKPYVGEFITTTSNPKGEKSWRSLCVPSGVLEIRFPEPVHYAVIRFYIEDVATEDNVISALRLIGNDFVQDNGIRISRSNSNNLGFIIFEDAIGTDAIWLAQVPTQGLADFEPSLWIHEIQYSTVRQTQEVFRQNPGRNPEEPVRPVADELVLEPETTYRLAIHTKVAGHHEPEQPDVFIFRTDKGPGIPADNANAKPVEKVEAYIDRCVPQHGAMAHYYGYDLHLVFNERYFEKLYGSSPIYLRLRDRNNNEVGNVQIGNFNQLRWAIMIDSPLLTWMRGLTEGASSSDACRQASVPPVFNPSVSFSAPEGLQPNTLYIADVLVDSVAAGSQRLIHQFQFTTSRYRNFTEHFRGPLRAGETPPEVVTYAAKIANIANLTAAEIQPPTATAPEPESLGARIRSFSSRFTERSTRQRTWHTWLSDARRLETTASSAGTNLNHLVGVRNMRLLTTATQEEAEASYTAYDELYAKIEHAFLFAGPNGTQVDLRQRGLPERLEFIRIPLADAQNNLILIESAEPVDWKRISGYFSGGMSIGFMPNQDATRAFLMQGSSLLFPHATYQMILTYSGEADQEKVEGHHGNIVNETIVVNLTPDAHSPAPFAPSYATAGVPPPVAISMEAEADYIVGNRFTPVHRLLNGQPRAFMFLSGSFAQNTSLRVQYTGTHWSILRQDGLAIPAGTNFKMMTVPVGHPNAFVHTADWKTIVDNRTYIDHPLANLRPNAHLLITQRGATPNPHLVDAAYDNQRGRWYLFNKLAELDGQQSNLIRMPSDVQFNVLVTHPPAVQVFKHVTDVPNIEGNRTILNHVALDDPNAMVFPARVWGHQNFGTSNPNTIGVQYTGNRWA
ncbi:MAG: hypothetical protein HUU01_21325, partial [Saprospiraceae bacterium]|nr:hypothetical protein [Saprospiraceae bacterium]